MPVIMMKFNHNLSRDLEERGQMKFPVTL
uniref:IAA-ALANINE RESISTANCE protein 1 n=1 Tax=Rhizophora mucronata TaxID=61149 RepID=A0A2P2MUZ3_RHIMU